MLQLRLAVQRWIGLPRSARTSPYAPLAWPSRYSSTAPQPPTDLSEGERDIYHKLTEKLSPTTLRVQDVSGGCGTFYAIVIASNDFKGLSTVKQHKLVTQALKAEIEGIHGLQLKTVVPE